jgi:hypothetical protein
MSMRRCCSKLSMRAARTIACIGVMAIIVRDRTHNRK